MSRLVAALGVVLGGLGVAAGLALLVGAWWARAPFTTALDDGADASRSALARVEDRLADLTSRLEGSQARLRALDAQLNSLVDPSPERLEATTVTLREVYEEELEPVIARTVTVFGSANPFVDSALTLLEAVDRVTPSALVAGVDARAVRQVMRDLQGELDTLPSLVRESASLRAEALDEAASGRALLIGSSGDIDRQLTSVRRHLAELERSAEAAALRLETVRAGLPRAVLWIFLAFSLLLVWWIVAQASLYASSLARLRRGGRGVER